MIVGTEKLSREAVGPEESDSTKKSASRRKGGRPGCAREACRKPEDHKHPEAERTKTIPTSEDRQNQGTIPMPTFATRPLTTSSTIRVELPQNYMVGQQRQQIPESQFDNFPNPQSSLVWKIRFKTQVTTCSDFPSDATLWIKETEMVESLDELKSSRSVYGKDFPKQFMERIFQNSKCWTRRLPLL